jgi:acyl-CoA reductase-like NAD-dependent aldehyde dehydrogenase
MDEYPGDVRLFINGSHVDGTGEGRQQVRSPASGDVIGSVPVPGQRRAGQPTDLYYEFTVADRVPLDSLFATEESFGPVVPIITADGEEDLLGIANSDQLGLQAAVFTRDISKAYRFAEELAVGQVVVNDSTCWWDINMPFGGAGGRRTGWGRIGGKHTLLGMTDLRTAAIHL